MSILLRVVGLIWIFLSAKSVWALLQKFLASGVHANIGIPDLLAIVTLAGGIGLMFLREWGRWVLLVGVAAAFLLHAGPSLLKLSVGPYLIRNLVFYGVFVALLLIPQAKAATRK